MAMRRPIHAFPLERFIVNFWRALPNGAEYPEVLRDSRIKLFFSKRPGPYSSEDFFPSISEAVVLTALQNPMSSSRLY